MKLDEDNKKVSNPYLRVVIDNDTHEKAFECQTELPED